MRAVVLIATIIGAGAAHAQQSVLPQEDYLSGIVESDAGPEAGVWVIAETTDLPTPYIKIVVTDDDGRFVIPELPMAIYRVWVRGYGLRDSSEVLLRSGARDVRLSAESAQDAVEAAQVYPADHWWSLLEPPAVSEFRAAGGAGRGLGVTMESQAQWLDTLKLGCNFCHQLGNATTRAFDHWTPGFLEAEGLVDASSARLWERRLRTGVRGGDMYARLAALGLERSVEAFADWTDRIAAGAVPPTPPRPEGIERNVVITLWDWGTETSYMHDEISTDKRNPTVNAGGPVYAVSSGHGKLTMLDPATHIASEVLIPTRKDASEVPGRFPPPTGASPFYGEFHHWGAEQPSDPHNPMPDARGRIWLTSAIRAPANPAWCREGSSNPFARYFPIESAGRHASYFDPETGTFTLIDTCFTTHHLQFGYDDDDTLWFNPLISTGYLGWLNTRLYDETGDEQAAQGWCPLVLDTNGDGRITKPWNEPGAGVDAALDTRVGGQVYGVQPSPASGEEAVVWASLTDYPGFLVRLTPGENPPETCISERFRVPEPGFGPRGLDVDLNGVVWTSLAGSSHLASFDRGRCETLSGPGTRDGDHCPEGWTLHRTDGPTFQGTDVPADFQYYNWVDLWNTSGLGANMPWAPGGNSDALLMLDPDTGEWSTFRVPYPLGFFQRLMDGRIDDPDSGWKGRGVWANYGTHLAWHVEGGPGTKTKIVKFQFRPDPLAY
ncbi:MAG TPA: carboxypeptidase-like regulatory domain-containing protein [Gammaproteobacteria bacterium]|nr:carboxypeptidase-like regulatory domain-containing protein [Gammaproteobacteria bacterium]